MKNWDAYINSKINSEIWGFILIDYYYRSKSLIAPDKFLEDKLTKILKGDIKDYVNFHRILLNVSVQLIFQSGMDVKKDAENIFAVSLFFLKKVASKLQEKQVIEIGEHYDAFKKKQEFCSYFTQHKGNLKISMDSKSRDLRIVETGKDISVLNSQEKLTPTKGLSYKEKKISVQGMGNKKTQAIVNAQSSRVRKRAIILTAIEEEFTVVRDYFENYTSEPHPKTKRDYKVGKLISDFFDWDVLLVQTGKFNDNAAAETALAIDHFEPEYVIFIGTAGRIKKDLNIGDILIPELVIGYNYGKANKNEFQISLENIKGPSVPFVEVAKSVIRNKEFMKSFKKVKNKTSWTIFKAYYDKPIASGNITLKDLNAQTAKDIKERFKNAAAAVDMEGIGFLKGCEKFSNIQYILIRSISDFLSNKVAVNKLGSRQVAAENALKMAIEILKNIK